MEVIKKYPNAPLTTIDWSVASSPPTSALSAQILDALENHGFFYIKNIEGYSASELEKAAKWFYGKSLDFKMQVARKEHNAASNCRYRGYKPMEKGVPDGRTETIELGGFDHFVDFKRDSNDNEIVHAKDVLEGGNLWPKPMEPGDEEEIAEFERIVRNHHAILSKVGMSILSHLSQALGVPVDTFEKLFQPTPLSSMRMIHYPAPEEGQIKTGAEQSINDVIYGEHTDSGCVTLLTTFGWGLQLLHEEVWYNVAPQKDAIICNVGETLVKLTDGRVNATVHRVAKIGGERFSVPFFVEPNYDAEIRRLIKNPRTRNLIDEEEEEEEEVFDWEVVNRDFLRKRGMWYKYGPWMAQNLMRVPEFRMVNFGQLY